MLNKIVVLTRRSVRNLNPGKLSNSLKKIQSRLVSDGRSNKGWKAVIDRVSCVESKATVTKPDNSTEDIVYKDYTAFIKVTLTSKRKRREDVIAKEWDHINKVLERHLNNNKWLFVRYEDFVPEVVVVPNTTVCEFTIETTSLPKEIKYDDAPTLNSETIGEKVNAV